MILVDFSKRTIFFLRLHITDPGYPIGHFCVNHLLVNDFFIQVGNTAEFYKLGMFTYLENVFKIYKYELTILISFFFKEIGKERKSAQDALRESRNLSESCLSTPTWPISIYHETLHVYFQMIEKC